MRAAEFRLVQPVAALHNANHRHHWRVVARKRAAMREAAFYAARNGQRPLHGMVRLTVTFQFPDRRHRDLDNYEIKGAIDGAVDAGLIPDDRRQVLRSVTREASDTRAPKGYAVLTFTFEEVG